MTVVLGPTVGAELLAQLGFLHVSGLPFDAGRAYVFIGLRRRPTLSHFDPERIEYWVAADGRGLRTSLDRTIQTPHGSDFSWGLIEVVDRKGVANRYLSFGGRLSADRVGDLTVAVFSSEAPILAHGGHSQPREPYSDSVASFFARLRAAGGAAREFEAQLCAVSPLSLYAAFVAYSLNCYRRSEFIRALEPRTMSMLLRERRRLASQSASTWAAGLELAQALGRNQRPDAFPVEGADGTARHAGSVGLLRRDQHLRQA